MAAEGAQGGGHTLQSRARTHTDRPQPLHQAATRSPSARTAQRPPVELAYVLVFTTSCRRHPADKEAAHLDLVWSWIWTQLRPVASSTFSLTIIQQICIKS
ncbi:unnamed protein product [Knipowitschia caucasica]